MLHRSVVANSRSCKSKREPLLEICTKRHYGEYSTYRHCPIHAPGHQRTILDRVSSSGGDMILQARAYDLKKLTLGERSAYGVRILTTRHWLRGIRKRDIDYWLPDAAPRLQLLDEYRAGHISGDTFLTQYEREQRQQQHCRIVRYEGGTRVADHVEAIAPLACLKRLETEHGVITILCWEPEPCLCHRHRLVWLLQDDGKW